MTSWVLGVPFSQIWKTGKAHPGPCWPYLEHRCGMYLDRREYHLMASLPVTMVFVLVPAVVRTIYGCHLVPRALGSDGQGCRVLGQPSHVLLMSGNREPAAQGLGLRDHHYTCQGFSATASATSPHPTASSISRSSCPSAGTHSFSSSGRFYYFETGQKAACDTVVYISVCAYMCVCMHVLACVYICAYICVH